MVHTKRVRQSPPRKVLPRGYRYCAWGGRSVLGLFKVRRVRKKNRHAKAVLVLKSDPTQVRHVKLTECIPAPDPTFDGLAWLRREDILRSTNEGLELIYALLVGKVR